MPLGSQWLIAFLLTELVETPIYCVWLRAYPWPTRFFCAFGASLLTHPVVWWSISAFGGDHYWTMIAIAEIAAVLTEAAYLRLLGVRRATAWSLLANGASYGLGLVCEFFLDVT